MNTAGWKRKNHNGVNYFVFENCGDLQGISHAFSTRIGGISPIPFRSLNLGLSTEDHPENILANRRLFLEALKAPEGRLCIQRQVHSADIRWVGEPGEFLSGEREGDGLITDRPGLLLGVLTADCCPVLLADPEKRVVAAVHAGWKGAIGAIAAKAVQDMSLRRGCRPSAMVALIGPTIGRCCFQVGPEVREAFLAEHDFAPGCFREDFDPAGNRIDDRWKLDMELFHRILLQRSGLKEGHIHSLSCCTRCRQDLFYSYRRDGNRTGRMLSVIGLR